MAFLKTSKLETLEIRLKTKKCVDKSKDDLIRSYLIMFYRIFDTYLTYGTHV